MERAKEGKLLSDLRFCPNHLDREKFECKAIIETPKNRRNKFDYDPEFNLFALGGLLPEGMVFPYDFGFIPFTLGEDGDPLDIMVLMDEPVSVGCLVDVRIIGVIEAEQTRGDKTEVNDRLIGVTIQSQTYEKFASIEHVNAGVLTQVEEFFKSYNRLDGREFKVTAREGPGRALALLEEAMEKWKEANA